MKRIVLPIAALVALLVAARLVAPELFAATPAGGTVSSGSATTTWMGGPFLASNPLTCRLAEATCDHFSLSIGALEKDYVVTVRITPRRAADDLDLFLRDPAGNTIASSATSGGVEELVLHNPPAGTYTVVVQPFLVVPGGEYDGVAEIAIDPADKNATAYHGVTYTAGFVGVPESRPARKPLVPQLRVSYNPVGRLSAEPTIGINANNTAFYAAATFDFPTEGSPRRLARTVVLRSKDKGASWQPVSPAFALSEELEVGEPPFTLDPMIYVDADAGVVNPATGRKTGRVFSVDLNLACGAYAVFSDDEGATWTRNPLFGCDTPVNDHHTIVTATPPAGLSTQGYPHLLYFWFNRVADSSGNRSHDGGRTFLPAGTAFTGSDTNAGAFCGGLHGHLAADSQGRIFLPKGHCGLPWVASSVDGGTTWTRVRVAGHTVMEDHEVSLAVDTADNIYAVWQGSFRLPFLSVSRDHGQSWSTPIMIAPPGVHEANFPTIVAGDPGRLAVLFPGSLSLDFDDPTRPWNIYVVVSTNALADNPTFTWTTANDPKDPVHRGSCGPGRCDAEDGGSMFDFLDIQVSPTDGAFWGTASDTCVGECVTNPQARKLRPGEGVAIREVRGPSLFLNR